MENTLQDYFKSDCTRCFIIGEVAQTHDGSLGQAHAFIDAIAETGANAIKFQTHIAAAESTPSEPFRIAFSKQDANRYEYWQRMEFTQAQWQGLADHAKGRGLVFLSSPFSLEAVDLLQSIGMPAWKVGSGEVSNFLLLEKMAQTQKPILLSSGMSTLEELDNCIQFLRTHASPFALFQTTTMYPSTPEKLGLNLIKEFRKRYNCPVGLSDHSATIYPGIAAYTLGARFVEVHVTMSRRMFGPDVSSSVTLEELAQLVEGIRFLEKAVAHPVDKNQMAVELTTLREIFRKSVVAKTNLPLGTCLSPAHLTVKKPGTGIPAERLDALYGKIIKRHLIADEQLSWDDIETPQR